MEFRRLLPDDLKEVLSCRYRALETEPNAYVTTMEEEKTRGPSLFTMVLSSKGEGNVIFGAIDKKNIAGMIGILRNNKIKDRHKAKIWGMYVDSHYRGKGIGGRLLDMALEHAREKMKVTIVTLSLESNNHVARQLYESRGFQWWGTEPEAMFYQGIYYNEDHMFLKL
jgi:ribosomal protein S18 acetylase RimI-like enzyme